MTYHYANREREREREITPLFMKKKKKPKETLQTCPFKEELTRINQVT
jgi:hypothetical protein